jgi:hypothetical protein
VSTLLQLEARVSARLIDVTNSTFLLATIDEALRTALSEYSEAFPLTIDTTITLPAAGREVSLTALTGLVNVLDVWWPYDSVTEAWPPNQVPGFHLWFNNAVPMLLISGRSGSQPANGDKMRVWYTKQHTINGLDGGAATTCLLIHESGIITGAAGYAAMSEMRHQIGQAKLDPGQAALLKEWADEQLIEFDGWLTMLSAKAPSAGALKPSLNARNPGAP